jgi:hypothetical protein
MLPGEAPSNRLRSKLSPSLYGFAGLSHRRSIGLISSILITSTLARGSGFISDPIYILNFIATIFIIPEIQEHSLEEVDETFNDVRHVM